MDESGLMRVARMAALAGFAALAACTAGPDYRRPPVEVPSSYKEASGNWRPAAPRDAIDRGSWWGIYRDPILDGLERDVGVSNQNLKAAQAAYREAKPIPRRPRPAPPILLRRGCRCRRSSRPVTSNCARRMKQPGF